MNRVLVAAAGIAVASVVLAGPLDPPAGPVSSTMKTLDQVEPRTPIQSLSGDATAQHLITQPGSYYLTGNITGVASKSCIHVAAENVSIDLCGFAIVGVANSGTGITVDVGNANIAVRNGTVSGWTLGGVALDASGLAENLIVSGSVNGIGIATSSICTIRNCVASLNGKDGISTGSGCAVTGCSSSINGMHGFSIGTGSAVAACASYANTGNGFAGGNNVTYDACSAQGNTGHGFTLSLGGTARSCAARQNDGTGIQAGTGAAIEQCSSIDNGVFGISASTASTVRGCTCESNATDGIRCASDCIVEHNLCDSNGNGGVGAGIHCIGSDTRIDSNNCTDNDIGFDVDVADNLIIRNSASGNTTDNWDIVANNKVGGIVAAPNSLAINGDTGGAGVGSTNPWSNFTY